ncbi:hypothetical protein HN587_06565 [Candidatus Woesearchaeota archaeon]|jgi:hypothetical protein|nr:hypothetical protein [Candidatus Woesearchaeota archaeon]
MSWKKSVNKNRKKILKNKKGFIASAIVDLYAYIVFVLVVLVFYFIFKWSADADIVKYEAYTLNNQGNYLVSVYLKLPVDVVSQDTQLTMGELMLLAEGDSDKYKPELISQTNIFLQKFANKDRCYIFFIETANWKHLDYPTKCNQFFYAYGSNPSELNNRIIRFLDTKKFPHEQYQTLIPSLNYEGDAIDVRFYYISESVYDFYGFKDLVN